MQNRTLLHGECSKKIDYKNILVALNSNRCDNYNNLTGVTATEISEQNFSPNHKMDEMCSLSDLIPLF